MMIPKILLIVGIFVAFIFCPMAARAAGFGIYGSLGGGNADWSPDTGWPWSPGDNAVFKKSTEHIGVGLVMDTVPARDRLFNYQLNLGYDQFRNYNRNAWGNAAFNSFVISNNFGFGTLINPTTRMWFGPELRIAWTEGSPDHYDYKVRLFGIGIGPVIGVNFNYDDLHTFALKAGFQYIQYAGKGDGNFSHSTNLATPASNAYNYDVTERMFYVTVELMFRTSSDR
jgi:hypothetical protein